MRDTSTEPRERLLESYRIAVGLARGQLALLRGLDLVGDPEDLQILGDRAGVHVDADDPLLALLQGLLVAERRVGDVGGEPAVLDAAQDAGVMLPS